MPAALTSESARHFAEEWIAAWNAHDLDAILSHYADEIVFVTPMAVKLLGDPSGTVRGIEALRAYFAKGLAAYPDLHFREWKALAGVRSVTITYISVKELRAAEVFELGEDGKVVRAFAHYAEAQ